MNAETFCEHFATFAEAPNGVAKLREMILQLAAQGKLVPQDPSDQPASVLLTAIQVEKAVLLEKGKIKRSVASKAVADAFLSYPTPSGWVLTTLGEISLKITDGTHKTPTYVERGVPFVSVKDFSGGRLDFSNTRFISPEEHESLYKRCDPRRGDILLARIGTLGKAVLVETDIQFSLFVSVGLIRFSHDCVAPSFLRLLMNSPHVKSEFDRIKVGGGSHTNKLNLGDLHTISLPLPPVAEQKRIVAKVDQLLGLCDELESRQAARREARLRLVGATLDRLVSCRSSAEFPKHVNRVRDQFDRLFDTPTTIPQLRQTIRSIALDGVFTTEWRARNHVNETGMLLVETIAEKKRQLSGQRLRKNLPLLEDSAGEIKLPEGWALTRLDAITSIVTSGSRGWKEYYSEAGSIFIRSQDIKTDSLDLSDPAYVSLPSKPEGQRTKVLCGDLLITITGANVGKVASVNSQLEDAYVSQHVALVRPIDRRITPFAHLWLTTEMKGRHQLLSQSYGDKPGLNLDNIRSIVIPMPSLSEQTQIVAKVNELMSLCDAFESKLEQAEMASTQVLAAAVHQLLNPA